MLLPDPPAQTHAVVVGGGTMGADVAVVLACGGCRVTVVEPQVERCAWLPAHWLRELAPLGLAARASRLAVAGSLAQVDWDSVALVVECIPEQLAAKQQLFAELLRYAPAEALLASNSSSYPISTIAQGLAGRDRMIGLHFFMPAHLVPLVEVVLGPDTELAAARRLCAFMRGCGKVPVLVHKDLPGFLANRLQHALAREAFALIDAGVASAEDVDAAVRFGFGFRFLAAGPMLQRDHAGLDVHFAAASTIYPDLACNTEPARVLGEQLRSGRLGMKAGAGFFDWPPEQLDAERRRYDRLLRRGLELLADELPPIDRSA